MAKTEVKEAKKIIVFPEGRLIHHSLFVMDQYDEKSTPSYKVEVAFEPKAILGPVESEDSPPTIEEEVVAALVEAFGPDAEAAYDAGKVVRGWIDGDFLARKREAKDKPGDAYKGKLVVRSNTYFNRDSVKGGAGGIAVHAPDNNYITAANQSDIYQGCYGLLAATIDTYIDEKTGQYAIKFYLKAFQKTRDGEKLVSPQDTSKLFKPVGRPAAAVGEAAVAGRRR
jgi:hypothetical protein